MSEKSGMTDLIGGTPFARRDFLKAGGALLIGLSLGGVLSGQEEQEDAVAFAAGPNQPDRKRLDTWIAIHSDNTATVFIGFVELGQGTSTALLQIAAEELDLDMHQVASARVDSNWTPNQGGPVASSSIHRGGPRIRAAAAEARLALLQLASKRLNAPVEQLTVSGGIVSVRGNPNQRVSYGELVGDKLLEVAFTGKAPLKPSSAYKVLGARIPRNDIPDKVSGKYVFMQHVRVPGMLHGRIVRPRGQASYGAGAKVGRRPARVVGHQPGRLQEVQELQQAGGPILLVELARVRVTPHAGSR